MKFLKPTVITDALLVSSNVPETDYAAWSGATTYALADRVISAHHIYESLQAANLNHAVTDAAWWLDLGATNRWKMFDQGVGSQTSMASQIVVTVEPGLINSIALLDIEAQSVQIEVVADALTIYDETFVIGDDAILNDWFEYFFEDIDPQTDLTVVGLPVYSGGEVTVTINAPITAKCGTMVVGKMVQVGGTRSGAGVSIIDYSKKETDIYGNTTLIERSYAKRVTADVIVENSRLDYVSRQLALVRATPCVWVTDSDGTYGSMTVYGFYRDWGININYPTHSEASLTIEGLV